MSEILNVWVVIHLDNNDIFVYNTSIVALSHLNDRYGRTVKFVQSNNSVVRTVNGKEEEVAKIYDKDVIGSSGLAASLTV